MRNVVGALDAQLAHGLEPDVLALVGDLVPRTTLTLGAVDDLVVDIGDVRDQADLETRIREIPAQNVVDQGGSPVAQMRWPVHRGAAEIDADFPRLSHGERFHALGGGVVEVQHSDKPTI